MAEHIHLPSYLLSGNDGTLTYFLAKCNCGQVANLDWWKRELTEKRFLLEWKAAKAWRDPTPDELQLLEM